MANWSSTARTWAPTGRRRRPATRSPRRARPRWSTSARCSSAASGRASTPRAARAANNPPEAIRGLRPGYGFLGPAQEEAVYPDDVLVVVLGVEVGDGVDVAIREAVAPRAA